MCLYNLIFSIVNPKSIFCKHNYEWKENIHGDEIISFGYKRTIYKCSKCGKEIFFDEYIKKDFNWNEL